MLSSRSLRLLPALAAIALAACSAPLTEDTPTVAPFTNPGDQVEVQLPPPPAPSITLEDNLLVRSLTNPMRVTGVTPGALVYILRSTGTGAPVCFTTPAICTNLRGPRSRVAVAGSATADASGVAIINVAVPASPVANTRYEAVADPFGTYAVSGVLVPRFVLPGADADGDGLNNGSEVLAGTDLENPDSDGGGISDGDEVNDFGTDPLDPTDDPIDADGDGFPQGISDCDDANPAINPDAEELCNGFDDNCNGVVDSDTWWDPAWPYRVPVTISAPVWITGSPPASVDIDFRAALDALGDTSALDMNSVRVVRQDCSFGLPELPSEWMDDISGVFEKQDIVDPLGDEFGAVAFQVDRDGDYSTLENFLASTTTTVAIYFGSAAASPGAPAPSYPNPMLTTNNGTIAELQNNLSRTVLRRTDVGGNPVGGLTEFFGRIGGSNVGRQASTGLGNGIYFNTPGGGPSGAWLTARGDGAAVMTILHAGPVFSAIKSEGTRAFAPTSPVTGGFDYGYTYAMFGGRPELYVKTEFVINTDNSNVGPQGTAWTAAVRPFTVDNLQFSSAFTSEGSRAVPDYDWVRGTYNTTGSAFGVAAGFRQSVLQRGSATYAVDGRWIGLVGQDYEFAPAGAERTLNAGDVVVDNAITVVYPHAGLFGSISVDFYGIQDGVGTSTGAPQAR
jgi:hypothetical protein